MKHNITVFNSCTSHEIMGDIDIWDWLLRANDGLKKVVDKLRNSSCEKEVKRIKSNHLPTATISGTFSGRGQNKLKKHSGLICIDIDGKDNPGLRIEDVKRQLAKLDYVMYCGLSVSGKGLMCIIKISNPEKHKGHFEALKVDFLDMGIVIDKSCSDISRLRIYSYDNSPYCNENSVTYTKFQDKAKPVSKPQVAKRMFSKPVETNAINPPLDAKQAANDLLKMCLAGPEVIDNTEVFPKTNKQRIKELIDCINQKQIDITAVYRDWFAIGSIIKYMFEGEGRELFHQISQYYDGYDYDETDIKYTQILNGKDYHYKLLELFKIAESYGIYIE